MVRKICLLLIFLGVVITAGFSQSNINAYKLSPEYKQAKAFIKSKKNKQEFYYGDGTVNMGRDPGAAKEKARKRALADLTSQISMIVQGRVTMRLSTSRTPFSSVVLMAVATAVWLALMPRTAFARSFLTG